MSFSKILPQLKTQDKRFEETIRAKSKNLSLFPQIELQDIYIGTLKQILFDIKLKLFQ